MRGVEISRGGGSPLKRGAGVLVGFIFLQGCKTTLLFHHSAATPLLWWVSTDWDEHVSNCGTAERCDRLNQLARRPRQMWNKFRQALFHAHGTVKTHSCTFQGSLKKRKSITGKNVSPDCTCFPLHLPMSGSSFVACLTLLRCYLNHGNTSGPKYTCFAAR